MEAFCYQIEIDLEKPGNRYDLIYLSIHKNPAEEYAYYCNFSEVLLGLLITP